VEKEDGSLIDKQRTDFVAKLGLLLIPIVAMLMLLVIESLQDDDVQVEDHTVRSEQATEAALVQLEDKESFPTTTTAPPTTTTLPPPVTTTTFLVTPATQTTSPPQDTSVNWDAIAECESGGDWSINTGNGYYGGLQFSHSTWIAYGGGQFAENAHQTSRENQIAIASGMSLSHWPHCGRYG
jgi:hypothetical protein